MKELKEFTVERLELMIESYHAQTGDVAALAKIALAAKQVKAVALAITPDMAHAYETLSVGEKLYTTPPLNHTEQHMVVPDGWIKCSERMPEDYRDVTVLSKEHGVVNGYYWSGKHWGKDVVPSWFIFCGIHEGKAEDISHWMPLPIPPAAPKPESE